MTLNIKELCNVALHSQAAKFVKKTIFFNVVAD